MTAADIQAREKCIDRTDTWRTLRTSGLLGRFIVLCVGIWLHAVDSLVTATIAPAIIDDIGGVALINWTILLYEVGAIVAGAASPALCQRLGIKRVLTLAIVIYAAGCILAATAPTIGVLLGARLAQGLGGGIFLSLCYFAIQQWFAPSWWSRLFGIVAVIWGAGSLLGPLIGTLFAALHSWRATFLAFAAQAAVLWVMARAWLPTETAAPHAAKPWPALTLLILLLATLSIAAGSIANSTALLIGGTLGGLALLYLAARIDRHAPSRLFPLQVLDFSHPVGAGLAMVFALSIATTGFWAYGPLLLKILFNTPPLVSGYILAGEAVAWSLATLAVSNAPITSDRRLIRVGASCVAAGVSGFALVVPAGFLAGMVACALLQGFGFGLCWPSVVHRIARCSTDSERPLAVTSPETIQRIGYAVGAAAVGIFANLSGLVDGISIAAAKSAAFWVFAAFIPVLLVALLGAWTFTKESALPVAIR